MGLRLIRVETAGILGFGRSFARRHGPECGHQEGFNGVQLSVRNRQVRKIIGHAEAVALRMRAIILLVARRVHGRTLPGSIPAGLSTVWSRQAGKPGLPERPGLVAFRRGSQR